MPGTMLPPNPPTVDGSGRITVEQFLRNPSRVQRVITDLTRERFIAERIFGSGDAQGGAVIYDQVTASELYTSRDVQSISPGSNFPLVDAGEAVPKVAAVTKWGGAAVLTYEAVRRDSRDTLNRQLTKLRNTIVRKVDTVAIAALDAAPINTDTGTDWSNPTTGDPILDVAGAVSVIDDADMGYMTTMAIANPSTRVDLLSRKDVRDALPRENVGANQIASGQFKGFMGLDWYFTNRVAAGTVYFVAGNGQAGSLRDELPLYSRTIDQPERERWLVQAARVTVPIVTDPKAVLKMTGV